MTKRTISLDEFLDGEIHAISETSDEELLTMLRLLERAHTHIQIERALRSYGESLHGKPPGGG